MATNFGRFPFVPLSQGSWIFEDRGWLSLHSIIWGVLFCPAPHCVGRECVVVACLEREAIEALPGLGACERVLPLGRISSSESESVSPLSNCRLAIAGNGPSPITPEATDFAS